MRLSLLPGVLGLAALATAASAQNPLELLHQQQSHYWFAASSVLGGPSPSLEAADDFNLVADVRRVRALGKSCFSCLPGDLHSARLRFYEWTPNGPGALQYELHLLDGDPRLTYASGPSLIDFALDTPFHATGRHFLSVQVELDGYWGWWASNYGQPLGSTVYSRPNDSSPWGFHQIIYPMGDANSDLAFELYGDDGTPPSSGVDPCGPWEVFPAVKPTDGFSLFLRDVKAFATDDVWAVGEYSKETGFLSWDTFSWIQHFDGTAWTHVPSPNPEPYPGGGYVDLNAVNGLAPDDVWAAGSYRTVAPDGYLGSQIFLVHWDGSSWTQVPAPMTSGGSGQGVEFILPLANDDVWFFGRRVYTGGWPTETRQALALHWDGSSFTYVDVPFDPSTMTLGYGDGHQINFASALAPDDIWAVGQAHGPDFSPVSNIWHWDGSSWQFVPGPTPGSFNALFAVAALAPDDVWASGAYTPAAGGPNPAFYLHWDGSSWTEVPAPGGGATLVVRGGPDDILSSAGIYGGQGVFRWDGTAWSKVMNFDTGVNPLIVGLAQVEDSCEVWGVGRQNGPDAGSLLVHLDAPALAASATVKSPCTGVALEQSLIASPPPTLGASVSFAAGDPTGATGMIPGSLAFLALSAVPLGSDPCGLPVAGLGPDGAAGELFLEPKGPVLSTAPWGGPEGPAVFSVPVPTAAALAGVSLRAQAVFVDAADGDLILTDAVELQVGP